MKHLTDIKKEYLKGHMKKAAYIRRIYNIHSVLFEYAEFIKNTDISNITIEDNSVVMTSRFTGARFLCAPHDRRIAPIETLNFGGYETEEFFVLLKLLKKDSVIFDIGANIGWYSIPIGKLFPRSRIYAFEPIPTTHSYLKKNIGLNHLSNISAYKFGFSNEKKTIRFYYYPEGSGNASEANLTKSKHIKRVSCPLRTIDDFTREKKCSVDVVKCDVEGAELLVFQGGKKTVQRDKPIILCEILRKWTKQFHYNPNEIIALFSSIGYKCFTIHDSSLVEFGRMDERTKETNFIFLHTVKHAGEIRKLKKK